MKLARLTQFAAASPLLVAIGHASAAYTHLGYEVHTVVTINGVPRSVYRVYANFTQANDVLFAWSGPTSDPIQIRSETPIGFPGSNFFNPGGVNGNKAPTPEQLYGTKSIPPIPNIQWGTFATIGVPLAEMGSGPTPNFDQIDQTQLTQGFPNFIAGNSATFSASCFAVPQGTTGQGSAGYAADGDPQLRVLMMQLTVNQGDVIEGEVDIAVRLGGSEATITIEDQVLLPDPPQPQCEGANIVWSPTSPWVDVDDLLAVINAWGPCSTDCVADAFPMEQGDGVVNVDDLLFVIDHWGYCVGP